MSMDIKADFNGMLEQLAEGFNTSVDKLYPILIKQAHVAGIKMAAGAVVTTIILGILIWALIWTFKRRNSNTEVEMAMIACFFGIATFLFATSLLVGGSIDALFNPEYWAIDHVISRIAR